MSPINKPFHKIKTSRTWARLLCTIVSSVVATAIIVAILAVLTISQADSTRDATSASVKHASPVQTPTPRRRRPIVVNQIPTPSQTNDQRASTCPFIGGCPRSVSEGTEVTLTAQWNGRRPNVGLDYSWSVVGGKITRGEQRQTMTLSTAGAGGKTVIATLRIGRRCTTECRFRVDKPKEDPVPVTPTPFTPTPTVTTTPTPTVTHPVTPTPTTPTPRISPTPPITPTPTSGLSPTPTPSPLVGSVATAPSPGGSPTESPTAPLESPEPTPPSTAGKTRLWPWILLAIALAIVLALAGAAAFAIGRLARRGGILANGVVKTEETRIERAESGLTAVIAEAKKKDEKVRCTLFAPHEAAPGDAFLVQAFAHLEEQSHQLSEIAKQANRDTAVRGSQPLGEIAHGEKLGLDLEMPGLEIDEPSQSLVWLGEIASLTFGVTVPDTFKPRSINCKLSVSRRGVPIGHIKFNFKISAEPQGAAETTLNSHPNFVVYKFAFISYASADRNEVMKRVQMLDLAKIKYFQDLLSLEAGKQWEPVIYRNIDKCDVFFLFWSTAAKKSKWVRKEVERALKRRGDKFDAPPDILGIPIEGPPPVKPPEYLEAIHFDSKFLYFINPRDGKS